jgi:subtilisin family serine protease
MLTAAGIAFSMMLGIVGGDRASAQTIDKRNGVVTRSTLARYTKDISAAAEQGRFDSFTDNQEEIKQAIEILSRGNQNNPVIFTDSQAVRNVIISGVAREIAHGNVPENLFGRRVLKLDLDALFHDTRNAAELKDALAAILSEAANLDSKIILFVDPIQALVGTSAAFDATVSDVVREVLAKGNIQCVGASTQATFQEDIGSDAQLASLFAGIELKENGEAKAETDDATENQSSSEEFTGEKVSAELSEAIAGMDPSTHVKVILQVENLKNAALLEELAKFGVTINEEIPRFGTLALELPAGAIADLAASGATKYLSLDRPLNGLGHVEATTGTDAMLATNAGTDGTGIGVAVLDSGISAKQKSLAGRIVLSRDFTGEGTTDDLYGHGTFVASMIAAKRGSYGGIATGANLINFRVLNSQGTGTTSALLNALNAVLTSRAQYNIRVVNLSLGSMAVDSYKNDPVCRAVRKLVNAGIVVVAAAGNEGKDSTHGKLFGRIHSPGNEPSVITVGAVNTFGTDVRSDDVVTTFSSRGPTRSFWKDANGTKHYDNLLKPDVVAPGNKIIGAAAPDNKIESENPELCVSMCQGQSGKGNMRLSGTSVSSPIVAGAAAAMLEANPSLTPNMIKMILMYTAQSLKGYNMLEQGAGELNVEGAVRLAKLVRTDLSASTAVGAPLLTSAAPVPTSTIAGQTVRWSQGVILNYNWAAGPTLITKYQAVYGEGVLLSDGVLISDGVLLADLTKFSNGVLLGDNILVSTGITMSDGFALMSSGVLLGDGVLLSDGVLVGDGLLVSDGVLVGDGVFLADRAGVLVADRAGVLVADSIVLGDHTNCMDQE